MWTHTHTHTVDKNTHISHIFLFQTSSQNQCRPVSKPGFCKILKHLCSLKGNHRNRITIYIFRQIFFLEFGANRPFLTLKYDYKKKKGNVPFVACEWPKGLDTGQVLLKRIVNIVSEHSVCVCDIFHTSPSKCHRTPRWKLKLKHFKSVS